MLLMNIERALLSSIKQESGPNTNIETSNEKPNNTTRPGYEISNWFAYILSNNDNMNDY